MWLYSYQDAKPSMDKDRFDADAEIRPLCAFADFQLDQRLLPPRSQLVAARLNGVRADYPLSSTGESSLCPCLTPPNPLA